MNRQEKIRVGILGGTFNPIHIGHLILAESAYEMFELDKIMIMPTCNPPHKKIQNSVTAKQRMRMSALAIANNRHFELSTVEIERQGITYTYETLERLKKEHPNVEYYFIMGADSLFSFESWQNPDSICQNCVILAATRNGMDIEVLEKQIEILKDKYKARIYILDAPNIDISSKEIRRRVSEKKSIKYFVHSDVEYYIYKNHLYDKNEV